MNRAHTLFDNDFYFRQEVMGGRGRRGVLPSATFSRIHLEASRGRPCRELERKALELSKVDYGSILQAPAEGGVADLPDADKEGIPECTMAGWCAYDDVTHLLAAEDEVCVIRSKGGALYLVRIEGYCRDLARTSAMIRLIWDGALVPL